MAINLLGVLLDIVDGVLHGLNSLSLVVRNRDTELLLKLHDQLDGIQ